MDECQSSAHVKQESNSHYKVLSVLLDALYPDTIPPRSVRVEYCLGICSHRKCGAGAAHQPFAKGIGLVNVVNSATRRIRNCLEAEAGQETGADVVVSEGVSRRGNRRSP